MSQNGSSPNPQDQQSPEPTEEQVTEDVGGVQGTSPDEDAESNDLQLPVGEPEDRPAPDAGEIEWAGQIVKKPPTPGA